jgi:hypothetical protein
MELAAAHARFECGIAGVMTTLCIGSLTHRACETALSQVGPSRRGRVALRCKTQMCEGGPLTPRVGCCGTRSSSITMIWRNGVFGSVQQAKTELAMAHAVRERSGHVGAVDARERFEIARSTTETR